LSNSFSATPSGIALGVFVKYIPVSTGGNFK